MRRALARANTPGGKVIVRDEVKELGFLLRSRFPILVVETPEEPRFMALVERAANLEDLALFTWSVASGMARHNRPDAFLETHELLEALKHIRRMPQNGVFVFFDAQPYLDNPMAVRVIRELALTYKDVPRTLVFVGSTVALPSDLQRMSATFQMTLPTIEDIRDLFREEASFWKSANEGRVLRGEQAALDMLIQHLVGFTRDDARRLIRQALEDDGTVTMEDVARVLRHKHEALGGSGALALEVNIAQFSDVGGQKALKHWLALRQPAFLGKAGTETLATPKGVLLLGVQGSGKSLAAKSVAGSWQVPLLRLDFGALYNKFQGETERTLRESLRTAQAMAPCILWLDEVEKGLATGDDSSDGGVSRRVLGTILTWMNDRKGRVFIVATANDISRLPAELLRKGRFDEIFFVDLPTFEIRQEILQIHLKKRGFDAAQFELPTLAQASDGFSGAELEQVVIAAQYEAFGVGEPLSAAMVLAEIRRTRPLSVVRAEEVDELRAWAADRTVLVD
jgi:SpoVK/Ycf46/Vps4 family AAA+-type ATPase